MLEISREQLDRARASVIVCAVSDAVVDLVGNDVRRFSNGMFTNNARDLLLGATQRSGMLDDRGRLQGLMTLTCLSETHFRLVLQGVTEAQFRERYDKFILFDDVEIESVATSVTTVQGPDAVEWLTERRLLDDALPHDRTGLGGFDVLGSVPSTASEQVLEAVRIVGCQPKWPIDMSTKQLPHEMNLRDHILHFEKGCYIGQEIIHRLDVQGGVRKRLVLLRMPEDTEVSADAAVMADERKQGVLRSMVRVRGLGLYALAVVRLPFDSPGQILTVGQSAAEVVEHA